MAPSSDSALEFKRRKIARTRLAVLATGWLKAFSDALLLCSVPAAAAVLSLRMLGISASSSAYPAAGTALLAALYLSSRNFSPAKSSEGVAAWLDHMSSGGGMLMAAEENVDIMDPSWEQRFRDLRLPRLDLRVTRLVGPMLLSALLFAFAIFAPMREARGTAKPRRMDISGQTAMLKDELGRLDEMGLIQERRVEEILEEMRKLEENHSALDPARSYEELDALETALKNAAESGFANFAKAAKLSAEFESAVSALKESPSGESERKIRDAAEKLKDFLEQNQEFRDMLVKGGIMSEEDIRDIMEARMPCDKETLEKIARSAKELKQRSSCSAKELCSSGLCRKSAEDLEAYLAANKSGKESCEGAVLLSPEQEAYLYGQPGSGGVDRGRGDAPMYLGSQSPEIKMGDKRKIESGSINPELGESVGFSFSAPSMEENSGAAISTDAGYSPEKGGTGRKRKLSPEESSATRKFFSK